ncbi:MAG: twin-arginine translocation signal domain-containing protein [Candidatus Acidiferrales bacterium]
MKSLLDRRTFLKDASALTVSAGLIVSTAAAITSADASQGPRIGAALFDGRYSSCRTFANALAREGAAVFDVGADVALLWYGPLRDHFTAHAGSVAGLTTQSDFVVSQSFGRERGLSLKYEGVHDSRGSRAITHRLRGLMNVDGVGAALRHTDSQWSEKLASALARTQSSETASQWKSSLAQTSALRDHPGFLTSWLLTAQQPKPHSTIRRPTPKSLALPAASQFRSPFARQ